MTLVLFVSRNHQIVDYYSHSAMPAGTFGKKIQERKNLKGN